MTARFTRRALRQAWDQVILRRFANLTAEERLILAEWHDDEATKHREISDEAFDRLPSEEADAMLDQLITRAMNAPDKDPSKP